VVLDDANRENEGDLIAPAQDMTAEKMAFMVRHSSGLICAPISAERTVALELPQMVAHSQDPRTTAYTISVDAAHPSVTTGISAHDRALVCRTLADPAAMPRDFRRPGHVIPLRAREGGVSVRRGHTESALDFCRLAGKEPAGVLCELVDEGEVVEGQAVMRNPGMLRRDGCIAFARKWGLKVVTIEDLANYLTKTAGHVAVNGTS
jgi:3,4-dihydroxy 2-butanone 4-phosphate synthase